MACAQITLYPLCQERLGPVVSLGARETLTQAGLAPSMGGMSTIVAGEDQTMLAALADAFARAAQFGQVVMTITVPMRARLPRDHCRAARAA